MKRNNTNLIFSSLLCLELGLLTGFGAWLAYASTIVLAKQFISFTLLLLILFLSKRTTLGSLFAKLRYIDAINSRSFASYLAPFLVVGFGLLHGNLQAQISGTVFRDYDGDGTRDNSTTTLEHGLGGITVKAYDANDPIATPTATTTTSATGAYSLSVAAGVSYRVEFTWTYTWLEPGHAGGSTVQFVTAPNSTTNCPVNNPSDYNVGDPEIVTALFLRGNLAAISGEPLVVSLFNSDGQNTGTEAAATVTTNPIAVDGGDVGAVWGLAWDKKRNKIYAASSVKTQSTLGPNGIGAIYSINNATNNGSNASVSSASLWVDLEALGKNLGTNPYDIEPYADAFNEEAFKSVGKHGFGDIDISGDGNTLYAVNLFNRSLFVIPIAANGAAPTSGAAITEVTIPSPASCTDIVRPFAVCYRDGKVYVGAVCTMEGAIAQQNSRNATVTAARNGMKAYVFEFNVSNNTFVTTPVLQFDLDYERTWTDQELPAAWYPWFDRFHHSMFFGLNGSDRFSFAQPMLSDIEFDGCDMILGFTDRMGNQFGFAEAPRSTNFNGSTSTGWSGTTVRAIPGGDLIMAGLNASGTWSVEGDGQLVSMCGDRLAPESDPQNLRGTLPSPFDGHTGSGPGGSEFYWGDYYSNSHNELELGALAIVPGRREVVSIAWDPLQHISGAFSTGGVHWMNTNNGDFSRGAKLYDGNGAFFFGKGAGLGDVEIMLPLAPIEVGNFIWNDTDSDGVQDPGEAGINGLVVTLWKENSPGSGTYTQIGTTTTAGGGKYGFSSQPSGSATGVQYDRTTLTTGANYQIRVSNSQAGNSALSLTAQNSAASGGITSNDNILDLRDSDASTVSGSATISFATGTAGQNNHTLDIGYKACINPAATFTPTPPTCTGATANNNGIITFATASNVTNFGISTAGAATYNGPAYPATTFTAVGQNVSTTIPNTGGTYIVRVFNGAANCFVDVTVTVAAVTCTAPCALTAATKTLETCNNNGTTGTGADDYITFSLNPTGTGLGASYSVTANNGGVVTRAAGGAATGIAYGAATAFRLQTGSANGTSFTITVTDVSGAPCVVTTTVQQSPCSSPSSSCKEFIYVNEVTFASGGRVHKFEVNGGTTAITEIMNGGGAWYPGSGSSVLPFPHGLGWDRNGYLYIGSTYFAPNQIRRLDCAGNITPAGTFSINNVNDLYNIDSYEGFIYSNGDQGRIYKWDPCTGAQIGYVQLGNGATDWGFSIDDNGKFYVTNQLGKAWIFTPNAMDFTSNTTFFEVIDLSGNPSQGGALSPPYSATGLNGITSDDAGNIYIVEGNRDNLNTPSRLLKFSSSGAFLAAGPIDANGTDGAGWNQMTGIVYSSTANRLYTTSLNPSEDCVYRWNTDLTSAGAAIGPVPGIGQAKGIAILSECCPVTSTVNISSCDATLTSRVSLSDLLPTDGVVCDGRWTLQPGSSNFTFNSCDVTATPTGFPACATLTLSNSGVTNAPCAPYTVTVNVSLLADVTAQIIAGNQTVCPTDNPAAFTVTTAASVNPPGATITYQWQQSTTSCTDGFTDIPGEMNATYDPGPISQTTYFRVIARITGCAAGVCEDISNCVTLTLGGCQPACALTAATKTLETCNNNGTIGNGADDYITFSLNPTGTNLGASYSVTANNGGTVTLVAGGGAATGIAYGSPTAFRLQNGSSNGTLYTITVTDVSGAPCVATTTVQQNTTCSAPPPCALTAITFANPSPCNNNGTNVSAADDYFTADITVTFSNPPTTGNLVLTGDVLVGGSATTVTVATAGAGPTYTFVGVRLRADGTASAVTATFSADNTCTFSVTNGPNVPSCSSCVIPVLATNNGTVCIGSSVSLVTLVTGNSPAGVLTFYTSQSDANAATNVLANSTVAPIANTTYYVRSETALNCFATALVSVTVNANPALTVTNGSVCVGGSINLATLVTNSGGGTLSFYTSQADANAGTNALGSSTVSPTTATNYYVRSTAAGCYGVKEITVTITPVVCGTPTVTGPN